MKKVKGVAIIIAVLCLILVFAACQPNTPINPNPNPNPTPNPDPTPDPDPQPSWSREPFDIYVANMGAKMNYRYSISQNGKTRTYDIDGNVVRLLENGKRQGIYWAPEGEKFYKYTWNSEDSKYHKTESEEFVAESLVFNGLQLARLTNYNDATGEYSVTIDGNEYLMTIKGSRLSFYDQDKETIYNVSDIGGISLNKPSGSIVVDDTAGIEPGPGPDPGPGPEPTPGPDDPIVIEDKIFTIDAQGNRVYNYQLLSESLLEALNKETDGKTLYQEVDQLGTTVEEIKYISTSDDKIEIAAVTDSIFGSKGFTIFNIERAALGTLDTKETLINGLKAKDITSNTLDVIQYSTDSEDEALATKVATAAKNVVNRLATDGVQDRLENDGAPIAQFNGAEVIYAYTKNYPNDGVGYGLGNVQFIGIKAIVKTKDGEYRFIDSDVVTQRNNGYTPFDIVVEGQRGRFVVNKLTTNKQVDKGVYSSKADVAKAQVATLGKGKGE